jgi:hypothetical protein
MGKVFHPGEPKDNDYPASWSTNWEYFNPNVDKCNASFTLEGDGWCAVDKPDDAFTDGKLAAAAVQRLGELRALQNASDGGQRWLLAVGFHKPHLPNAIPMKYYAMQQPLEQIAITPYPYFSHDAPPVAYYECTNMENASFRYNLTTPVPDDLQREYRRAYHGGVSFVDAQAGRVLDALEANGFKDNTVVPPARVEPAISCSRTCYLLPGDYELAAGGLLGRSWLEPRGARSLLQAEQLRDGRADPAAAARPVAGGRRRHPARREADAVRGARRSG